MASERINGLAVDLEVVRQCYLKQRINNVPYLYGGKADDPHTNPKCKGSLAADSSLVTGIDCSGETRYLLYKGTGGKLAIPDGSQEQLRWAKEQGLKKLAQYEDVRFANYMRAFIAFIKPFENGCGDVGHVWLVTQVRKSDPIIRTIESHGGHSPRNGVDDRAWNYKTLLREAWAAYELPVLGGVYKV